MMEEHRMNKWVKKGFMGVVTALALASMGSANVASAEVIGSATASEIGTHVHVALFFKIPGENSFVWPEEIPGEDIMGALEGKADFLIMTQTVKINDGDVINVQNDTLRSAAGAGIEDIGANCQLTVMTSKNPWTIAGKCDVFIPELAKHKTTGIIMPHPIESERVWHHVWDDPVTGVAVYFFKETGPVLGH
jgi:hypothetical protein